MIASKPYVFPPRIMLTSLEIVRVLIIECDFLADSQIRFHDSTFF